MRDQLTESEERFRALVTATSDVIYKMSPDWSVLERLNSNGFLADSHEPINNWIDKYVYKDDQPKVLETVKEAIETVTMFKSEHRVLRADNTIGWTLSRAVPIVNAEGNIVEWFGTADDVSSRKNTETELAEAKDLAEQQKRLYETITANTPDLIYVFDLNYKFTYANEALLTMWGKSKEEAIGKGLLDNGYEPWHAEMHEREIDKIKETKLPVRGEVAFPHAVLGKRIYDYIFTPVINENGDVEAIAGTTRDITEIKEEEQRKNDFINIVSHELKTPLTSALAYVQVSKTKTVNDEDHTISGILDKTERQLKKMTSMINSFLNVSRLQTGEMLIEKQSFDIVALTAELKEEIVTLYPSHNIKFETDKSIIVYADRDKISHVITNLLSNAIKYSKAGSEIGITLTTDNAVATCSVTDRGIGIRAEDITKIFERYYRIETEVQVSGFGIGLYLCDQIIRRHEGTINVMSDFGNGSTFTFSIPLQNI